jgi:hypothetical protein
MAATIAVALAALTVPVANGVPRAFAATDAILSQGKPVTVSGTESSAFPPGAAVDGNSGTRWSSAWTATQWFEVDLGSAQSVDAVDIDWEAAYAKAFTIQFSTDNSSWTTAYSTTSGTGGQQNLAITGTARYVRINLIQRALTAYGYSFWEFQVYGPVTVTSPAVTGVAVVNDATHKPILGFSPLVGGDVIDLTRLANHNLSLQANLAPGVTAGSVSFTLTGAKGATYTHVENTAPYFLCTDYVDCAQLVAADSYTLTVQPYSAANATGGAIGPPYTVAFGVSATAVPAQPINVLFVGDSLIGTADSQTGEDTPALVRHLATTAGRTVNVTEVIEFGNTLQQTWNSGAVQTALNGTTKYDYIVLQEYSTLVATNLAQAQSTLVGTYGPTFAGALKPGGKVVLFEDWALVDTTPFPTRGADVAAIDTNYAALSAALATPNLIAPIGDEFETEIAAHGTSYLIVSDGKHPNDTAIYLDAATLYGILFRVSPRGLANLYVPAATATELLGTAATAIGY